MRRGGLGDTLLMVPVLRAMRAQVPAAVMCLAGIREYAEVLVRFGVIDRALSSESLGLWGLHAGGAAATRARSSLAPFDWIVGDDPILASVRSEQRRVVVFDPRLDASESAPAAARLLARAGLVGSHDVELLGSRMPAPAGVPIVLHAGSGGRNKCLPASVLRDLAGALARIGPVCVVLGPTEVERRDRIAWPEPVTITTPASIDALVDVLAPARAYVGHDSGPTHLAAALRVPTCAVFVATDPRVWAPRGAHVRVVDGSRSSPAIVGAIVDAVAGMIGA